MDHLCIPFPQIGPNYTGSVLFSGTKRASAVQHAHFCFIVRKSRQTRAVCERAHCSIGKCFPDADPGIMMPRVTDECLQPHNDETPVDIFFGGSCSKRRQTISHSPSQQSASTTQLLASLSSLCIHTCNRPVASILYLVTTFVSLGSL
jgi:hypothetical protein